MKIFCLKNNIIGSIPVGFRSVGKCQIVNYKLAMGRFNNNVVLQVLNIRLSVGYNRYESNLRVLIENNVRY